MINRLNLKHKRAPSTFLHPALALGAAQLLKIAHFKLDLLSIFTRLGLYMTTLCHTLIYTRNEHNHRLYDEMRK